MDNPEEKIQLPKIRKLLHTNLVDIRCILNPALKNSKSVITKRVMISRKFWDAKARVTKSGQQSPNFHSFKDIELDSLRKSVNNQCSTPINMKNLKERYNDRSQANESGDKICKTRNLPMVESVIYPFPNKNTENLRRGMSGSTISKLYKSRYEMKKTLQGVKKYL